MVRNSATMPSSRTTLVRGNGYRWRQALLALVIMLLISPYEYTFTIFEQPIATAHHWSLPSVAATYTIYIVVGSLFMIPSGRWSDRWQPRWFTTVAGLVTGLGWITAAFAQTRPELYLAYGLGALGPGYIYCNCVNNALKWFPESARRGMAVGLIEMGFGLGSAIFIPILTPVIDAGTYGYRTAFVAMGVAMLVITAWAALLGFLSLRGVFGDFWSLPPRILPIVLVPLVGGFFLLRSAGARAVTASAVDCASQPRITRSFRNI